MKSKKILLLTSILLGSYGAFAQYEEDAFRFSTAESSTSARLSGMGGQHTALGGDISSLYGNPAGLGMYSSSDFSFGLGLMNNSNKANFLGNSNTTGFFNPNINNVGVVFHSPIAKTGSLTKGLLSMNFGIGYQKTNFFRNQLNYTGETNLNGLSDYFQTVAPGSNNDELVAAAIRGGMIEMDGNGGYFNNTAATSTQYNDIDRKGGQSNFDLTLGMNFSNTFYLGFGIGIASVNYRSENVLRDETYNDVAQTDLNSTFVKSYDTRGSGLNFKVGAILKPVNAVRIGVSLESPTYYNLDDNYYESLELNDDYGTEFGDNGYPVNYDLTTPLKLNGGVAFIVGSKGLISADVSYRDYSNIKFSSDAGANTDRNVESLVRSNYKEAINYGLGGEYKITPAVAVRAGYRFIADANRALVRDYSINKFSGGIGYRFGNYYLDGALSVYDAKSDYAAYEEPANYPLAEIKNNVTNVSLTFGARF